MHLLESVVSVLRLLKQAAITGADNRHGTKLMEALMKHLICIASIAILLMSTTGCATSRDSTVYIRKGYRDISIGKPRLAEKRAQRILRHDERQPAALVLLAKAKIAQNDKKGALAALDTLDYTNPADWACPDRIAVHEGLLLKGALAGDMEAIYRARDVENSIETDLKSRHFITLVQYHEDQGDPIKAAVAFERFEQAKEKLVPEERIHGFILYYSTLRMDDARRMWKQLTPKQRTLLQNRYEDIEF